MRMVSMTSRCRLACISYTRLWVLHCNGCRKHVAISWGRFLESSHRCRTEGSHHRMTSCHQQSTSTFQMTPHIFGDQRLTVVHLSESAHGGRTFSDWTSAGSRCRRASAMPLRGPAPQPARWPPPACRAQPRARPSLPRAPSRAPVDSDMMWSEPVSRMGCCVTIMRSTCMCRHNPGFVSGLADEFVPQQRCAGMGSGQIRSRMHLNRLVCWRAHVRPCWPPPNARDG